MSIEMADVGESTGQDRICFLNRANLEKDIFALGLNHSSPSRKIIIQTKITVRELNLRGLRGEKQLKEDG